MCLYMYIHIHTHDVYTHMCICTMDKRMHTCVQIDRWLASSLAG